MLVIFKINCNIVFLTTIISTNQVKKNKLKIKFSQLASMKKSKYLCKSFKTLDKTATNCAVFFSYANSQRDRQLFSRIIFSGEYPYHLVKRWVSILSKLSFHLMDFLCIKYLSILMS